MKENDKIENNDRPPEQNSGADRFTQSAACSPASTNGGCVSSDNGRLTTDRLGHSSARRRRAPYRHRNHRRTGKVARLPAPIRHEICLMFTRYKEYRDIIAWLASQGHPGISESNLSRWRKGGFQDWLRREQEKRLDLITMALDVLTELVIAERKVQPATDKSHSSGNLPSGSPHCSTNGISRRSAADAEPRTTDSPRFNEPST